MYSDTAKERIITSEAAGKVLKGWFAVLTERDASKRKPNGRAWRAQLRRMELPYGAITSEGYSVLLRQLQGCMTLRPVDQLALALFVSVAVYISSHKPDKSFAAQLGEATEKKKNKACFSELRFQRLQQAADPNVFCQQLIRAVKIRGAEGVNILSLADSILLWMREWEARKENQPESSNPFERNRIRWATEYLSSTMTLTG